MLPQLVNGQVITKLVADLIPKNDEGGSEEKKDARGVWGRMLWTELKRSDCLKRKKRSSWFCPFRSSYSFIFLTLML